MVGSVLMTHVETMILDRLKRRGVFEGWNRFILYKSERIPAKDAFIWKSKSKTLIHDEELLPDFPLCEYDKERCGSKKVCLMDTCYVKWRGCWWKLLAQQHEL